ncbi:MAG TPA: hypothetical protein VFZ47_03040 [Chitinophagaceae bacterium]
MKILVEHLGGRFSLHGREGELWHYSPFRSNERTTSFKIEGIVVRRMNHIYKGYKDLNEFWMDCQ